MQNIEELNTEAKLEEPTVQDLSAVMKSRLLLSSEQYSNIINQLTELKELFRQNATASVQNNPDDFLNLSQASVYTGFSKSFIYKITAANDVTFYKPNGKTIVFKRVDLDNFLCRRKIQSNLEISLQAEQSLISHRLKSV